MRIAEVRNAVVGLLVVGLAWSASAADAGRVLRSAVFPGMGQLGDNQTARGLLYMGGEIVLVSLTVDEFVKKAAYDRSTEYLKVEMDTSSTYELKQKKYSEWQDAVTNSQHAQMMTYVFGGAAVVWWAWNIVDAIVFKPKEKEGQTMLRKIRDNTVVAIGHDKAVLAYRFSF